MGLYLGKFIIRRIFSSEIWGGGLIFGRAFFFGGGGGGGGGLIAEFYNLWYHVHVRDKSCIKISNLLIICFP